MAKDLAIVLNSGGLNSAVMTAMAAQKHRPIMVHADGAGISTPRMRVAYDQQVQHFKPYREHSLPLPYLATFAQPQTSGLSIDPRHPTAPVAQMIELLPLLAGAVRFAVHYGAHRIYTGFRVGGQGDDLAQATEYLQIWNELLQLPCGQAELEIESPLLELEPWQVVDIGFGVNAPFDKTWTCLEEGSEPCWACRLCRSREQAFQQAAKPDPLRIVKKV
jgi:7-cyano-7-deazaguanine synthase in queuosine biosynthesis